MKKVLILFLLMCITVPAFAITEEEMESLIDEIVELERESIREEMNIKRRYICNDIGDCFDYE